MDLDLLTKGTQNTTIFSVSNDGKLTAARPITVKFHPNMANITTVVKPQYETAFLSAPRVSLPENYDSRNLDERHGKPHGRGAAIKNNVLDQKTCGSCYSYSTTSTLTDMLVKKGYGYLYLNPVAAVCRTFRRKRFGNQIAKGGLDQGCLGGFPSNVVKFFEKVGAVEDKNYKKSENWNEEYKQFCKNHTDQCANQTDIHSGLLNVYNDACAKRRGKYFAKPGSLKSCVLYNNKNKINIDATIQYMKNKIFNLGAITSKFSVFKDFQVYSMGNEIWKNTKGVYIHNMNNSAYQYGNNQKKVANNLGNPVDPSTVLDGGHAVELIGWGTATDVPYVLANDGSLKIAPTKIDYWWMKNSWGPNWGENGFCKIAMYRGGPSANYSLPINEDLGLDIPHLQDNISFGGAITFEPGKTESVENYSPSPRPGKKRSLHFNEILILSIVGGLLFCGFVFWLVAHLKVKKYEKMKKR